MGEQKGGSEKAASREGGYDIGVVGKFVDGAWTVEFRVKDMVAKPFTLRVYKQLVRAMFLKYRKFITEFRLAQTQSEDHTNASTEHENG